MIITQTLTNLLPPDFLTETSRAAAEEAIVAIAAQARAFWIQTAQENLTKMQLDYINAIQEPMPTPGKDLRMEINLVGQVAAQIENGTPSYDMHNSLLGPNVPVVPRGSGQRGKHQRKDGGFYRAIPFFHQAPNTVGVTGTPIGRPYAGHPDVENVAAMAKRIYKAAKALSPTTGTGSGPIKYGGRLPKGMAPKLRPHHKTDIYAGMIRQEKTYRAATQSTYTTFRSISTGSPGWVRRAIHGRYFALKVSQEVRQRIAPETFAYIFKKQP